MLTIQLMGIIFTLSRGPWFGTILWGAAFLGMVGVFVGWRTMARTTLTLVIACAVTIILIASLQQFEDESSGGSAAETAEADSPPWGVAEVAANWATGLKSGRAPGG